VSKTCQSFHVATFVIDERPRRARHWHVAKFMSSTQRRFFRVMDLPSEMGRSCSDAKWMVYLRIPETLAPGAVKRGRLIVNTRLQVGILSTLILNLTTSLLLQIT
jgi:CHASE1-domain containing sensor protein